MPAAQVALAWLLHKPGVTAPIVGATKLEHLDDAVAAEQLALDADRDRAARGAVRAARDRRPLVAAVYRLVVRPLGDFAGFAGLLDHEVVVVGLDDAFELRVLVAGEDEEEPRLLPYPLVGVEVDGELVGAAVVRRIRR